MSAYRGIPLKRFLIWFLAGLVVLYLAGFIVAAIVDLFS